MKKSLLTIIIILTSILSYGQSAIYMMWKMEAEKNIRLVPKYGNVEKTQEQKDADQAFIKTTLQTEGTKEKASENLVRLGFSYLSKRDFKTAMYRFNQAWLLNPENENAFWGFGGVYFSFNDYENALKQYEEGLSLNPKSSNILTDKATVFMSKFNDSQDPNDLSTAINLFKASYNIDPKNQSTLFKMSVCYYLKSDCLNARKFYEECMLLGGQAITKEYTAALKQTCKK